MLFRLVAVIEYLIFYITAYTDNKSELVQRCNIDVYTIIYKCSITPPSKLLDNCLTKESLCPYFTG